MKKFLKALAAPLLLAVSATPAAAIDYEFTDTALLAMAAEEEKRTRLCVSLDSQGLLVSRELAKLAEDLQAAETRKDTVEAERLRIEISTLTSELEKIDADIAPCEGLVLFKPVADSYCARIPVQPGSLCEAAARPGDAMGDSPFALTFDELFAPEITVNWELKQGAGAPGPEAQAAEAAVRKGNVQVRFTVRAEGFDKLDPTPEGQGALDDVYAISESHSIALEDQRNAYAPFLVVEMLDGAGLAGETHQVLAVFREGGQLELLTAPSLVLPGQVYARHGVPLDADAWAGLSGYAGIGIAGVKRGAEADEMLYFIGIESDGLKEAMDRLMEFYKSLDVTL